MNQDEITQRVGILIRDGREFFYARFGRCLLGSYDRSVVVDALRMHEPKLADWDKLPLEDIHFN